MAADTSQIFKCNACGIVVQALHGGPGELVCCGKPMRLMKENTTDAATEKHVPVIEKAEGGFNVSVGSVQHPMQDDHYIEWIEATVDGKSYRQFLNPGDVPQAFFPIEGDVITAREHCNLHGVWKA